MNGPKLFIASMIDAGLTNGEAETVASVRFHKKAERRHGEIKMAKQGETAEILLYEEIGFDFWTGGGWTPQRLVDELEAMKPFDKIQLRINSPGGNAFDGITIFNILRRQEASIAVEIEGIAASAASFIAQVADAGQLTISEAGSMVIHRGQGVARGDTNVMLEMAGILEKLDNQIAGFYAGRSGIKAKKWLDAMTAETWYFGKEAIEAKLADKSTPSKRIAACADWSQFDYQHVPERLLAKAEDEPEVKPDEVAAAKVAARLAEIS